MLALICFLPGRSWGHAFPDHADPKVGSTVAAPPALVRIWFDSRLEPLFSSLMVHDAKDEMISRGSGRVDEADPTLLEADLPPLRPGTYRVMWSVVSRDGHRTSGSYTFTIRSP